MALSSRRRLLLTVTVLAWLLGQRSSHAEVVFAAPRVDLGKVKAAGTIEHRFRFRVQGAAAEIVDLVPSCGCVKPVLKQRHYQPGEEGEILFGIHATGQQPGPHDYSLNVTVRDPVLRTIRLGIVLDLHSEVTVTPSHVLIYSNGTRPLQQTVQVRDSRPRKLDIAALEASSKRIQPAVRQAKEDPAVKQVVLNIAADYPVGQTEDVVVLTTNDPEYPRIEIPVLVIRSARVRSLPDKVFLRQSETASRLQRSFVLTDREMKPVKITNATCEQEGVHLQWSTEPARHARVNAQIEPRSFLAAFDENTKPVIRVHISEPEEMELVVPIHVE